MVNEFFQKNPETGEMELVNSIVIDESQFIDDMIASQEEDMLNAYKEIERLKQLRDAE